MIQANKIYRLYDILSYLIFYGINNKYPFLIIEEKLCKSEFIKSLENNNASIYLYRHNLQDIFKDVYGEDITINDITKTNPISMWVSEAYIRLFYKFHKTFHYLFLVIHLDKAISLFNVYHEMDYEQLYELFTKLQSNFKLLNALIDEKNITIRQLSLLSSISEHTLYNYSKNNNKLYSASFNNIVSIANILNIDSNIFIEKLDNQEDYSIYSFDKTNITYRSYLAIYYLDYYYGINSNKYTFDINQSAFSNNSEFIKILFLESNDSYIRISNDINPDIEPLVKKYKEEIGSENNKLVIFEWNQISKNDKAYKLLSKYGFEDIYIINQENIIRINAKGKTSIKHIQEFVSNYLIIKSRDKSEYNEIFK